MFQWLGQAVGQALGFIGQLLAPVWALILAAFYLLGRLAELLALLVELVIRLAQLVGSFAVGLVNTLIGLTFRPQDVTRLPFESHDLGGGMAFLLEMLEGSAFDVLAPVLAVAVWFVAGWAVLRIAGAR